MIHALFVAALQLTARPELGALYQSARSYEKASFRFVPPSEEACKRTRALVAHLVHVLGPGAPPAALVAEAKTAGFVLESAYDAAGELWVLHEPDGQRAGAGLFVFRAGGSPLAVEAPHTFFDEGTGDVAQALFARLRAGAMFCNTVHRYSPSAGGGEHPADVAHAERTLFAAANQGLLDTVRWAIVQVHGFGDKQGLPAEVKAVVSDGVAARAADAPAVRLRAALAARWGAGSVRLYGVDADVLGATTNVEGKVARKAGAVFLHVEMSSATRRALGADVAPLATALSEILRAPRR
jgi:hypothetical protein